MAVAANKDTTSFRNLWKKIKSNNNKSIPQNNKKGIFSILKEKLLAEWGGFVRSKFSK